MTLDPLSGVLTAWQWLRDHWYVILIIASVLAALVALWFLYKKTNEEEPRRDAVKRAMKETFSSASASGSSAIELVTLGNAGTRSSEWGKILGVRETSHAVFVHAMPSTGIFRWFQRRRFIIARHLVADTRSRRLEVKALGMTPYEDVWIPDDDFQDPEVLESWKEVLVESREDLEAISRDLPSCVLAWYLRIVKAETFARAAVRSFDDIAYNWHMASSSPLKTKTPPGQEAPSMTNDREDRERAREQEAGRLG